MLYLQFMSKIKPICQMLLAGIILMPCALTALTVGTYNSPPFSMHEDGEDIGMATEAVRKILSEAKIKDYTILEYPISRGIAELKDGRVDIYYPYVKHYPNMDGDRILIGPIAKYQLALFVRKDSDINAITLASMQHMIISAERGGIGDNILSKNNIPVEQATQKISCLRMVVAERVAACAIGILPGQYTSAINNLAKDLRYIDLHMHADMYVALGTSLSPEIVQDIQQAFKKLKKEDYFVKQQRDYEKKFQMFIRALS